MKKLFMVILVAAMALVNTNKIYGQTEIQSATLQQGDKTSVFYGVDAFVNAFNAVTSKTDVITLSPGSFRTTTINKSCKIYGAGCERDDAKKIYPTVIGDTWVLHGKESNPDDGSQVNKKGDLDDLYIEGCCIDKLMFGESGNLLEINNLTLKRCRFEDLSFDSYGYYSTGCKTTHARIINCIIVGSLYMDDDSDNFSIQNSIVNSFNAGNIQYSLSCIIKNCILFSYGYAICTYKDNIIMRATLQTIYPSCYFENNIFKSNDALNSLAPANNINNWTGKNNISIFGEEVGETYDSSKTYAIKPEVASTYIGSDGTPVGLYGGAYPFTKTPSTPQIISKEIGVKSTEDGKLKVSIKVEAQK